MGVSSAAVSQQVRNPEAYFGKQLFLRIGNRITLTDAGHAIYRRTARALGDIATVTSRILEGEVRTRLVVSVPFSLAEHWRPVSACCLRSSRAWRSTFVSKTTRSTWRAMAPMCASAMATITILSWSG
ncbi:LysR family transcriptional regulator [Aminobacter ciceronei]|uniref:LysR family transcriptional regulator n=1 Tax=Aminobacter ciceronei TaxID=150723 RepID=UPI003F71A53A